MGQKKPQLEVASYQQLGIWFLATSSFSSIVLSIFFFVPFSLPLVSLLCRLPSPFSSVKAGLENIRYFILGSGNNCVIFYILCGGTEGAIWLNCFVGTHSDRCMLDGVILYFIKTGGKR